MEFSEPLPFKEALEKLADRGIVPSGMDSTEWRAVEVAIREKAFFSSRVESARVLQSMKDYLGDYMAGTRMDSGGLQAQGRAEFVADMRELAIREGLGNIDPNTGEINPVIRESDLTDIRSSRRLQLIFDTQVESSQEYGFWKQGQDPDLLYVFPAQQFIRVRPVMIPRPYHQAAEGSIRRKDDLEFWLSMNLDFNVPWGPWGFGSGMGVEDVDREEAIAAGVMLPDAVVRPIEKEFKEGLSASVRDLEGGISAALARITGGELAGGRLVARERVMPRNTRLDPELIKKRVAALARPDALDVVTEKLSSIVIAPEAMAIEQEILSALTAAGRIFPPDLINGLRKLKVEVPEILRSKRNGEEIAGSYKDGIIRINGRLAPEQQWITAFHEVVHWVADDSPAADAARRKIATHFKRRTRGEKPVPHRGLLYLKDRWYIMEAGRPDGSEVASYYLEMLTLEPEVLANRLTQKETRETLELVMQAFGIQLSKTP